MMNTPDQDSARARLHRLADVLSDYECGHLLNAVTDISAGTRFWEGDFGLLYNEHAKLRYFRIGRNPNTGNSPLVGPPPKGGPFIPIPVAKSYPDAPRVEMPPPMDVAGSLGTLLLRRRSRRAYDGGNISLRQLSTLLRYACGVAGDVPGYGYDRLPLRTFPSHGGLQAPEVYVCARAVQGIEPGLYHYAPLPHALESLNEGDHSDEVCRLAFGEDHVRRAAAVLFCAGCYGRLRWKYGDRAYRFICVDTGFVGQSVYLVAEALGLGVCAISGFAQDAAEEFLGIDGKEEIALLLMSLGSIS